MSISIQQNIPFITPVHNSFYTVVSSTNTTQTNFRYVFDVFTGTTIGSSSMVARRALLPRPVTNNCIFSPQGILRNYLSYDRSVYSIIASTYSTAPAYGQYVLSLGEEYLYTWHYTDFFYCSAFPSTAPYSAFSTNIGLTGTTQHYYSAGDVITITHQPSGLNPQFNSSWTVLAVPNPYQIITSMTIATGSSAETGTTIYSDLRSSILSGQTFFTGNTFNAAIQILDQPNWDYTQYMMTGATGTKKFLTNQPRTGVKIKDGQYGTLAYLGTDTTASKFEVKRYQTSGGTLANSFGAAAAVNNIIYIPSGIQNLNSLSSGLIDVDRDYKYEVYLFGGGFVSEAITYLIDDDCQKWDTYRFMFLNKLGTWDYFNAVLKSYESNEIVKTNFDKIRPYNFTAPDRGQTTRFVEGKKKITVWTDFVNNAEARWIVEELLPSPEVYWLSGTTSTVTQIPIVITTTGAEIYNTKNKKLNQYAIDFYLSNDLNTQSNS